MSQPFDRGCKVELPGTLDEKLDQFWEDDPWQIMTTHNQSGFERNRAFLNQKGKAFLEMSHLTDADTDADSRTVAAGDFNNDGRVDLLVRGVGGGALQLFKNEFPAGRYLKVSLLGSKSNRLGIGARLTLKTGDMTQVREMFPVNSFSSQDPCVVHFGLGDAETVDQLVIRWPSGITQEFKKFSADRHIIIHEGDDQLSDVVPGTTISPEKSASQR